VKIYTQTIKIGVLSTGNELVSAGIERLPTGKIRDSNKTMLQTIIREFSNRLNISE
jgi:molybdopterin biosynthesis enzyme